MERGLLLARIISYVLHPLLLPTLGLLTVFNIPEMGVWLPPFELKSVLLALTFSATFLLPVLNALLLLKFGMIQSLRMETRQERNIPYLATAVFYSLESWLLIDTDVSALVRSMVFCATLVVIAVLLINFFWKISAHMAGIGSLCSMLIVLSFKLQIELHVVIIVFLLLAGLVGYARLKLDAHTPAQVYFGFLLGASMPLLLFI